MKYRITHVERTHTTADGAASFVVEEYVLIDHTDTVVRVDVDPRKLSRWAFANDAVEVRHEYDLRKAEQ